MVGIEEDGIHETLFKSILRCADDIQNEMYGNIILSGGNTMFENFKKRLKECQKYVNGKFKREYNMRRREFAGYGQHDTLEFCRFLLDDISKEINKGNKVDNNTIYYFSGGGPTITLPFEWNHIIVASIPK